MVTASPGLAPLAPAFDPLTDTSHPMLSIWQLALLHDLDNLRAKYLRQGRAREAHGVGSARKRAWAMSVGHEEVTSEFVELGD